MGERITYATSISNKTLKDLIFEHFAAFKDWYVAADKSSIEAFNEPFDPEVKSYLWQNPDFMQDFDTLDQHLIDELTAEFIGMFCDLGNTDILESMDPWMNKWRYEGSGELVAQTNDPDFLRLWNYLIIGRSLKDDNGFDSFSNEFAVGFLSYGECMVLKEKIETNFGTREQLKRKYSNEDEVKLTTARTFWGFKKRAHVLPEYRSKLFGFELVLQVLEELGPDKIELLSTIDLA